MVVATSQTDLAEDAEMTELRWTLKALLSHYWRHPWQALFLISGLVAGVALWSAVQVINAHAQSSYEQADSLMGVQREYTIYPSNGGSIDQAAYIQLRRQGWTEIFPVIEARVEMQQGKLLSIIATDLFALPTDTGSSGVAVAGDNQSWLDFIQPPYQAWYPKALAEEIGVAEGQRITLKSGDSLPPALIQDDSDQGWQLLMDIGAAQTLLARDTLDYLAVGHISAERRQLLEQALPASLVLVKNQQALNLTQLTESLHTNLSAMSLLSFAVGLFIVFNAMRFSLWYRQQTVKNLRLMGVGLNTLAIALLLEAFLWSVLAAGLGLWAGYGISLKLLPTLGSMMDGLYGAKMGSELLLKPITILIAWLMTLIGLLFALSWPMWRLTRQSVIQGSQLGSQWQQDKASRKQLGLLGILLAVAAVLLYPLMDSVLAGFVLLGLILFSAAWILPFLLATALTFLSRFIPEKRPLLRWMISDGWAQLPTLRTAMMALLLALTCNLGVESLIGSFRTSFTDWLSQRLTADIYVREQRPEITNVIMQGEQQGWLTDTHARTEYSTYWQQRPTLLSGLEVDAPDTQTLPLAKAVPEAMHLWAAENQDEPWILANEQVHYLAGVKLGESIVLDTSAGSKIYKVAGFFYDYGNASFQFYLPQQQLLKHWPQSSDTGIALWLNDQLDGGKKTAMVQAEKTLIDNGFSPGDWMTQSRLLAVAMDIFERTFTITLAMNTLTLIVAGLALLTSLMAILQERLPQFAGWSALGVNRREQLMIILIPLLLFVTITWLVAVPLGALLSWLLIHKLNVMSFGWSMPMLWSATPALVLAALCLCLALFSVFVTGLRLRSRLPKALAELGSGG